ncbi:MAG TPA: DUF2231 domain-containing protein [Candidatus Sulfotelmatobacter sp.]|nr:DUF2231 domain-containing protein [Candidatus Sulfotelmatobacter sp.]
MSPFDPETVLLAKHAQHVVMVHFPIALLLSSFIFDLLAVWRKNTVLASAARYNLLGAAITALFAIGTGLAAWQWQLAGAKLKGNLRLHLLFALASGAMILVLWICRQHRDNTRPVGWFYLGLAWLASILIAFTAHLGGFISGINLPIS